MPSVLCDNLRDDSAAGDRVRFCTGLRSNVRRERRADRATSAGRNFPRRNAARSGEEFGPDSQASCPCRANSSGAFTRPLGSASNSVPFRSARERYSTRRSVNLGKSWVSSVRAASGTRSGKCPPISQAASFSRYSCRHGRSGGDRRGTATHGRGTHKEDSRVMIAGGDTAFGGGIERSRTDTRPAAGSTTPAHTGCIPGFDPARFQPRLGPGPNRPPAAGRRRAPIGPVPVRGPPASARRRSSRAPRCRRGGWRRGRARGGLPPAVAAVNSAHRGVVMRILIRPRGSLGLAALDSPCILKRDAAQWVSGLRSLRERSRIKGINDDVRLRSRPCDPSAYRDHVGMWERRSSGRGCRR